MTDSLRQRYEVDERGGIVPTKNVSEILEAGGGGVAGKGSI